MSTHCMQTRDDIRLLGNGASIVAPQTCDGRRGYFENNLAERNRLPGAADAEETGRPPPEHRGRCEVGRQLRRQGRPDLPDRLERRLEPARVQGMT